MDNYSQATRDSMKRTIAYVVFAVIYGGLLLLADFAADNLNSNALGVTTTWVAPFAIAPFALLVAMRLEHLSKLGVATTSVMLAVVTCVATVALLVAIAVPVVGGPTYEYVAGVLVSYFVIGGWELLLSFALFVAAPMLWSAFLSRRLPVPPVAA